MGPLFQLSTFVELTRMFSFLLLFSFLEYSSLTLQTETYEKCLETYFLQTCFGRNGTIVGCDNDKSIDSFQMPDW